MFLLGARVHSGSEVENNNNIMGIEELPVVGRVCREDEVRVLEYNY